MSDNISRVLLLILIVIVVVAFVSEANIYGKIVLTAVFILPISAYLVGKFGAYGFDKGKKLSNRKNINNSTKRSNYENR